MSTPELRRLAVAQREVVLDVAHLHARALRLERLDHAADGLRDGLEELEDRRHVRRSDRVGHLRLPVEQARVRGAGGRIDRHDAGRRLRRRVRQHGRVGGRDRRVVAFVPALTAVDATDRRQVLAVGRAAEANTLLAPDRRPSSRRNWPNMSTEPGSVPSSSSAENMPGCASQPGLGSALRSSSEKSTDQAVLRVADVVEDLQRVAGQGR